MVKHFRRWRLPSSPKCMLIGVRRAGNWQEVLCKRAWWRRRLGGHVISMPRAQHGRCGSLFHHGLASGRGSQGGVGCGDRQSLELGQGSILAVERRHSISRHNSSQLLVHAPRICARNAW
jgi:hypothetical protein